MVDIIEGLVLFLGTYVFIVVSNIESVFRPSRYSDCGKRGLIANLILIVFFLVGAFTHIPLVPRIPLAIVGFVISFVYGIQIAEYVILDTRCTHSNEFATLTMRTNLGIGLIFLAVL